MGNNSIVMHPFSLTMWIMPHHPHPKTIMVKKKNEQKTMRMEEMMSHHVKKKCISFKIHLHVHG